MKEVQMETYYFDGKANSGKPNPQSLPVHNPGVLTIGNYLGAVRNWSEMLDQHDCYFGS